MQGEENEELRTPISPTTCSDYRLCNGTLRDAHNSLTRVPGKRDVYAASSMANSKTIKLFVKTQLYRASKPTCAASRKDGDCKHSTIKQCLCVCASVRQLALCRITTVTAHSQLHTCRFESHSTPTTTGATCNDDPLLQKNPKTDVHHPGSFILCKARLPELEHPRLWVFQLN